MIEVLEALDRTKAAEQGLASINEINSGVPEPISLPDGLAEYLRFLRRPKSVKGVDAGTVKRYLPILNRAVNFFRGLGITNWSQVGKRQLDQYAAWL